jgi:hypothetical protein
MIERLNLFARVAIACSVFALAAALLTMWKKLDAELQAYQCNAGAVIVQEGDTLFHIARKDCWGNVGNAVDDLVASYGARILPGQRIYLPASG